MNDALEQQFVNETIALLKTMNEKYHKFFHYKMLTLVPMGEDSCNDCVEQYSHCKRIVIGIHDTNPLLEESNEKIITTTTTECAHICNESSCPN